MRGKRGELDGIFCGAENLPTSSTLFFLLARAL
jgi:hypothetical protein